jgi:hypothetical protein
MNTITTSFPFTDEDAGTGMQSLWGKMIDLQILLYVAIDSGCRDYLKIEKEYLESGLERMTSLGLLSRKRSWDGMEDYDKYSLTDGGKLYIERFLSVEQPTLANVPTWK